MVEYLRNTLTVSKRWIDPEAFTKGLVTCQGIPGAIVVNLASYCGYQIRGLPGLLIAFASFLLPSFLIMLVFSAFYKEGRNLGIIKSAFIGLEVVVVAIVINAAGRFLLERVREGPSSIVLSIVSATLLLVGSSPLLVIALTGALGALFYSKGLDLQSRGQVMAISKRDGWIITLSFASCYCLIYLLFGGLFEFSCIMTKIALMSFGGVYTALPLMYHEVVQTKAWMDSKTFMDGIALGQITPGPILINATFVGYITGGLVGALVGTFAIFAPGPVLLSIVMTFVDKIDSSRPFRAVTKGMVAAFAGLLIFVSIKFTLAVHWDITKLAFFVVAFGWLIYKNDVLALAIVGAILSMILF